MDIGFDRLAFDKYFIYHDSAEFVTKVISWRYRDKKIIITIANGVELEVPKELIKEEEFDEIMGSYVRIKIDKERVVEIKKENYEERGTLEDLAKSLGLKWKDKSEFLDYVLPRVLPLFGINYIEFSEPGTGKTTTAKNYPYFFIFTMPPSPAQLVYNVRTNEYGIVANYRGIVFDEVQNWKITPELRGILSTGIENELWARGKVQFKKRITAVFFGNPRGRFYSKEGLLYYKIFTPELIERFHVIRHCNEFPKIVGNEPDPRRAEKLLNYLKKQIRKEKTEGKTPRETKKLSELYSVLHSFGVYEFNTELFN